MIVRHHDHEENPDSIFAGQMHARADTKSQLKRQSKLTSDELDK
jgi:hypothetical protein